MNHDMIFGGFIGLMAGIALAFAAIMLSPDSPAAIEKRWQLEAIDHNCAAFDPRTGEWGWLDEQVELLP